MRLIFAGTPGFAAQHLQALADSDHDIAAVYTQPDRETGRGRKKQPSPVKQVAEARQLPVYQPATLRDPEAVATLAGHAADLMIVVAYGLILPQTVLDTPRHGCLNVHASLLPRWRGAAPVERAILAGDQETGITIMQMDAGLDTGDMLHRVATPIREDDTRETVEQRLSELGCEALLYTLAHYSSLAARARSQNDELSTYARKLEKSEALIDWNEPAVQISRRIRAGVGRLPASADREDQRIRLLEAQALEGDPDEQRVPGTIVAAGRDGIDIICGDGVLRVTRMQLPGKKPTPVRDVLNARSALFEPGLRFLSTTAS